MRSVVACGVALLLLSVAVPVQAALPTNDYRANAAVRTGVDPYEQVVDTVGFYVNGLVGSSDEPNPEWDPVTVGALPFSHSYDPDGSENLHAACYDQEDGASFTKWYAFAPTTTAPVTASLLGDAHLALLGGSPDALEMLRCEYPNADDIVFNAHAGMTYYIAVVGVLTTAPYTFSLAAGGTPARHDDRADARVLAEGVKYFNVNHAVREPGEPNLGVAQTLWFRYKATQDAVLHLNADYWAPASYYPDFATMVGVWDDAGESAKTFEDGWFIDAGRTYEIQVGTESEGDGQYRISLSTSPRPDAVTGLVGSLPEPDLSLVSELVCWATYCNVDE
ncbi:MAG: hypothetical protein ACYC2H_02780 [Thermoplasmatota archaeon]